MSIGLSAWRGTGADANGSRVGATMRQKSSTVLYKRENRFLPCCRWITGECSELCSSVKWSNWLMVIIIYRLPVTLRFSSVFASFHRVGEKFLPTCFLFNKTKCNFIHFKLNSSSNKKIASYYNLN